MKLVSIETRRDFEGTIDSCPRLGPQRHYSASNNENTKDVLSFNPPSPLWLFIPQISVIIYYIWIYTILGSATIILETFLRLLTITWLLYGLIYKLIGLFVVVLLKCMFYYICFVWDTFFTIMFLRVGSIIADCISESRHPYLHNRGSVYECIVYCKVYYTVSHTCRSSSVVSSWSVLCTDWTDRRTVIALLHLPAVLEHRLKLLPVRLNSKQKTGQSRKWQNQYP